MENQQYHDVRFVGIIQKKAYDEHLNPSVNNRFVEHAYNIIEFMNHVNWWGYQEAGITHEVDLFEAAKLAGYDTDQPIVTAMILTAQDILLEG